MQVSLGVIVIENLNTFKEAPPAGERWLISKEHHILDIMMPCQEY